MKIKYEVISLLASSTLNFLGWSYNFEKHNYKPEKCPAIFAIWHGLQYSLGGIPDRKNLHILISKSKDGEVIAYTVEKMGFSTVRGSAGRGGVKATLEIIKTIENDGNIAYTVDGPKGPGFKVKKGLIKIAQMSKRPIIPVSADAKFKLIAPSWDKYQLPLPWAKTPLVFGDPIYVPEDASDEVVEEYRLKVEKELFKLREKATNLCYTVPQK